MKKLLPIFICFFIASKWVYAQDEYIYSQYIFHPILANPAYAGFKGDNELLFNYKNQFSSFPGSPKSYTMSYHGGIAPKLGFGALLFNDVVGDISKFKAQGSLAYRFDLGSVKLNTGLAAQFSKHQLSNGVSFDPNLTGNDPLVLAYADGLNFFSSSLGIYGEQNEKLKFGISVVDLVRTRIDEIQDQDQTSDNTFFKYFNAFVGYKYDVKNYNFSIEPSVMVKRLRNIPFQTDFNVKMAFLDDQLFGGVSYSIGGFSKSSFMLGTRINKFKILYSYDIAVEEFQKYNNGGHEISLSFDIASKFGSMNK